MAQQVEPTVNADADAEVASPFRVVRNQVYATHSDSRQTADLYLPDGDGPFPAVMLVHGGAWVAGQKDHTAWHARRLAMRGFVAIAIEYRLAPIHKFPAQLEDCRAALAWIGKVADRYQVDTNRLAAYGYSAGGHLVCLLAMTQATEINGLKLPASVPAVDRAGSDDVAPTLLPQLKAVVAGGPPCEFRDVDPASEKYVFWLGDTRARIPGIYEQASPTHFVTDQAPPVFLFHGTNDRVVSKRDSQLLHQKLTKRGVASELYLVPNAGHLRAFLDQKAFDQSVSFLKRHLAAIDSPNEESRP